MVRRRFIVLLACVIALGATGAAQGAVEGDLRALQINESAPLNITLENPLPIIDVYTVSFSGDGFLLIQPEYPPEEGNITQSGGGTIRVSIGPNQELNLTVNMEGTAIGQGILTATVNSSTTQLSAEDDIAVRVEPNFGTVTVSAPGITLTQVVLLAVLGALAAAGLRREDFKAGDANPAV